MKELKEPLINDTYNRVSAREYGALLHDTWSSYGSSIGKKTVRCYNVSNLESSPTT